MPGQPGPTGSGVSGGPVTRSEWVTSLLIALGNSAPTNNTRIFLEAWTKEEGNGECHFNFLNTKQKAPGSTNCNSAGVQSYPDVNTGIQATVQALRNGNYPSILHALQTNDENNLGFNGHPIAGNIAGDLSVWVSGRRSPLATSYIQSILSLAGNPGTMGGDITSISGSSQPTTPPTLGFGFDIKRITTGIFGGILLVIGLMMFVKQLTGVPITGIPGKVGKVLAL